MASRSADFFHDRDSDSGLCALDFSPAILWCRRANRWIQPGGVCPRLDCLLGHDPPAIPSAGRYRAPGGGSFLAWISPSLFYRRKILRRSVRQILLAFV